MEGNCAGEEKESPRASSDEKRDGDEGDGPDGSLLLQAGRAADNGKVGEEGI